MAKPEQVHRCSAAASIKALFTTVFMILASHMGVGVRVGHVSRARALRD